MMPLGGERAVWEAHSTELQVQETKLGAALWSRLTLRKRSLKFSQPRFLHGEAGLITHTLNFNVHGQKGNESLRQTSPGARP